MEETQVLRKEPEAEVEAEGSKPTPQERLQEIDEEAHTHTEAIVATKLEMAKVEKSFIVLKRSQEKQIDEILEGVFANKGDKAALDEVFKTKIVSPKLRQAQETIGKLKAKHFWHNRKLRELVVERQGIHRFLAEQRKVTSTEEIQKAFQELVALITKGQEAYDLLQQSIGEFKLSCAGDPLGWTERLSRCGMEPWGVTLIDSYMNTLRTQDLIEFLYVASGCSTKGNPFSREHTISRREAMPFIGDRQPAAV